MEKCSFLTVAIISSLLFFSSVTVISAHPWMQIPNASESKANRIPGDQMQIPAVNDAPEQEWQSVVVGKYIIPGAHVSSAVIATRAMQHFYSVGRRNHNRIPPIAVAGLFGLQAIAHAASAVALCDLKLEGSPLTKEKANTYALGTNILFGMINVLLYACDPDILRSWVLLSFTTQAVTALYAYGTSKLAPSAKP